MLSYKIQGEKSLIKQAKKRYKKGDILLTCGYGPGIDLIDFDDPFYTYSCNTERSWGTEEFLIWHKRVIYWNGYWSAVAIRNTDTIKKWDYGRNKDGLLVLFPTVRAQWGRDSLEADNPAYGCDLYVDISVNFLRYYMRFTYYRILTGIYRKITKLKIDWLTKEKQKHQRVLDSFLTKL